MTLSLNIRDAAQQVEAMLTSGRDEASLRSPLQALGEHLNVRL